MSSLNIWTRNSWESEGWGRTYSFITVCWQRKSLVYLPPPTPPAHTPSLPLETLHSAGQLLYLLIPFHRVSFFNPGYKNRRLHGGGGGGVIPPPLTLYSLFPFKKCLNDDIKVGPPLLISAWRPTLAHTSHWRAGQLRGQGGVGGGGEERGRLEKVWSASQCQKSEKEIRWSGQKVKSAIVYCCLLKWKKNESFCGRERGGGVRRDGF